MYSDVIMAGFGGQGVMLIGKILAYCGMIEDKHVVWIPSYGPEMRGGTANCTIVVSDSPIASPIIANPNAIVVLNKPSLDKFEPMVRKNGLIIINETLIDRKSNRDDVRCIYTPGNKIAMELGNAKATNMVMFGTYIAATGIVGKDTAIKGIEESLKSKAKLIPLNIQAFEKGYELGLN